MKRGFSILVLCVLLAHAAGFYVYFLVQLKQIRMEMRAELRKLPPEKLELIKLTSADFKKVRVEEHEIKVSGKMYDIARIEITGDDYFVYCLHDEAENSLLALLDKILTLPLKDKSAPSQVLKFSFLTFILPSVQSMQPELFSFMNFSIYYSQDFRSFIPVIDSPPPRIQT